MIDGFKLNKKTTWLQNNSNEDS